MTDARVRLAGEDVVLLPERALFWPRAATLVAADFHWGKGATFRAAGIPIPTGATGDDLSRLDAALLRTCARRLVVLGDLFHARAGRIASSTLAELRRWRALRPELEILLDRGNHDRHAGDPPEDLHINCLNAPSFVPPFVLRHEPADSPDGYTLAGHLHPGMVLSGPGRWERPPCFWLTSRTAVLPAFGSFTGLATVSPEPSDRIFVIADDEVLSVG